MFHVSYCHEEDSKIDPEKLLFDYTPHLLYILGELINRITYSYQIPQTLHVTGNFGAAIKGSAYYHVTISRYSAAYW